MGERLGKRTGVFGGFLAAGAAFGLWPEPDAGSKKVDDQVVAAQEEVGDDDSEVAAATHTPELVLPGRLPKLRGMPDVASALAQGKSKIVVEPAQTLTESEYLAKLQNTIKKSVEDISNQLHGFTLQPVLKNDLLYYRVVPNTTSDVEQVNLVDFWGDALDEMRLIPTEQGFVVTETKYFEPSVLRPPDLAAAEINDRLEAARLLEAWIKQEQAAREAETFLEYLIMQQHQSLYLLFKPAAIQEIDKKYGKKKDGNDDDKEKDTDVAQA